MSESERVLLGRKNHLWELGGSRWLFGGGLAALKDGWGSGGLPPRVWVHNEL